MPKRTCSHQPSLALELFGLGAFLLLVTACAAIVIGQRTKMHAVYSDYQRTAETNRRGASLQAAEACVGKTLAELPRCIADRIFAHEDQKARDQDLQAQQEMAFWTYWLFIVSAIATGVSALGIYLLWQALLAARETFSATKKQAEIAESALFASERPWVKLEAELAGPLMFDPDGDGKPQGSLPLSIKLTNIGKSPALNTFVYIKALAEPYEGGTPLRDYFCASLEDRSSGIKVGKTLFPGEELHEDRNARIDSDDIREALLKYRHSTLPECIAPDILICAAYDAPGSSHSGETGVVFNLCAVREAGHTLIKVQQHATVDPDTLNFASSIVGAYVR